MVCNLNYCTVPEHLSFHSFFPSSPQTFLFNVLFQKRQYLADFSRALSKLGDICCRLTTGIFHGRRMLCFSRGRWEGPGGKTTLQSEGSLDSLANAGGLK